MPKYRINTPSGTFDINSDRDLNVNEQIQYAQNYLKRHAPDTTTAEPKEPTTPLPMEAEPEAQKNLTMAESIFPRTNIARQKGLGFWKELGGAAADVASLPGRAISTVISDPKLRALATTGMTMPIAAPLAYAGAFAPGKREELARLGAKPEATGIKKTGEEIVRSPGVGAALMTAPLTGPLAAGGLAAKIGAGTLEGAISAGAEQAGKMAEGKPFDPQAMATETAISAAFPVVGAVGGRITNKALGRMASELSGISEDALRKWGMGFGKGAKELQEAAGKQYEIGQKLVRMLDNADEFLPERELINGILETMPQIDVDKAISRLSIKRSDVLNSTIDNADQVADNILKKMEKISNKAGVDGKIPAAEYRKIRVDVDKDIGDAFGKESGEYVNALKDLRHGMAQDLIESAEQSGNPQYVELMKSYASKLQAIENAKQFLGKSAQTRANRAESFVSTLFGANKTERQNAVKAVGDIFGEDFLEQTKLARLAAEIGEGAEPAWFARQPTGRSMLGLGTGGTLLFKGLQTGNIPLAAMGTGITALTSPKVATKILPVAGAIERVGSIAAGPQAAPLRAIGRRALIGGGRQ